MIVIFSRGEIASFLGIPSGDVEDYLLLKFAEVGFVPFKRKFATSVVLMVMDLDIFMDPEDIKMNAVDAFIRDMGKYHGKDNVNIHVKADKSNPDRIFLEIFR